jgi:phenylalanyl-tRNA synthetase beta chain
MKLPLSWLRQHVELPADVEEIAATLVRLGIEVEGIETPHASVHGVRIGHILSMQPHPNADRLRLLQVDIGESQPLGIVCGATNMQVGDKVPVATVGACLPGGVVIKAGKIRGETSHGMCCSEKELGLAEDADGLMILPEAAPTGEEIGDYLGFEEATLDLSITPNRGDCMSVRGIARELAAIYGTELKAVDMPEVAVAADVAATQVSVANASDCPLYYARRIEGIKLGPSPAWLERRLLQAGQRPVNGVVDVLNYLMLETGQPMHAFDADALHGGIRVMPAAGGEAFEALDGRVIALDVGDLVVADDTGAVALAGIMGSKASGVGDATCNLLLESALFRPARVSLTRRHHGMVSEASMRFERGIDAGQVRAVMERATAMILELFGGKAGPVTVAGGVPVAARRIEMRTERIQARLGIAVPAKTDRVLERMGFGIERKAGGMVVAVPAHRHDVALAEDIIEEYARIFGYDNIPEVLPPMRPSVPRPSRRQQALTAALQSGYMQVISYAFISPAEQRLFADDAGSDIVLANPISDAMAVMRRSIWPGLLAIARHNMNRQQPGVALVEQGRIYTRTAKGCREREMLAWLVCGEIQAPGAWQPGRVADFFDLKGSVEAVLARLGLLARFAADDNMPGLQPGQSARILAGRGDIGRLGRLDAAIAEASDLDVPVFVAEIDLDALPEARPVRYAPLPEFPGVWRDLVFLFPQAVRAEDILGAARKAGGALVTEASVFDRYVGKGIPEGRVSLGIRLALQSPERTLTQEEVEAAAAAVVAEIESRFGASLR